MTLTATGAAIIAFALLSCLLSPRRLMQAIVFFASFSATAVVNFNNYGVAPVAVFVPVYLVWKVASGDLFRPVRVGRDHLLVILPIVGFAAVSIASLLINQALRSVPSIQLTQTAYVLFGILITLVLSVDFAHRDRLEAAIQALRAGAVFVALWGVMQAICYYTHIPYPSDLFNNSTSHFADMFDQRAGAGLIRIASVATEPSFMAVSLMIFGSFGATLLTTEPRFRTRAWVISVSLALLVVAASTSTTGYFGIAILALLLGMRRPGLMLAAIAVAALAMAAILALLPSFGGALYEVTLGKTSSGSYLDRSGSVWDAFRLIAQQPLFGWGWGGNFSLSIVTQLLACIGGIGTALFLAAVLATLIASRAARLSPQVAAEDWRLPAYAEGAENAMLVYMAQSVVTGFHFVVADFWCLWALAIAIPSCIICNSHQRRVRSYSRSVMVGS